MKNKKYHNVGRVTKSNRNIIEREAKSILPTQIYMTSLSWLGTGPSIKSGGFKLVLSPPTFY